MSKPKRLRVAQKAGASSLGTPRRPMAYELVGRVLVVKNIISRCEQALSAYYRVGIVGTWQTSGDVLIQPEEMHPESVARCDCYNTLAIELPGDASVHRQALRVLERGDSYAGKQAWANVPPVGGYSSVR